MTGSSEKERNVPNELQIYPLSLKDTRGYSFLAFLIQIIDVLVMHIFVSFPDDILVHLYGIAYLSVRPPQDKNGALPQD